MIRFHFKQNIVRSIIFTVYTPAVALYVTNSYFNLAGDKSLFSFYLTPFTIIINCISFKGEYYKYILHVSVLQYAVDTLYKHYKVTLYLLTE